MLYILCLARWAMSKESWVRICILKTSKCGLMDGSSTWKKKFWAPRVFCCYWLLFWKFLRTGFILLCLHRLSKLVLFCWLVLENKTVTKRSKFVNVILINYHFKIKTKLDMQKVKQQVTLLQNFPWSVSELSLGTIFPFRACDWCWVTRMLGSPQDKPSPTGFL